MTECQVELTVVPTHVVETAVVSETTPVEILVTVVDQTDLSVAPVDPIELVLDPTQQIDLVVNPSTPELRVDVGVQGPPGPPGDALSVVAGMDLGGHRVIALDARGLGVYADCMDDSALRVHGISRAAADEGSLCPIVRSGHLDYPPGGLTPSQPLFLGSLGLMSQSPPSSGWVRQVGVALAPALFTVDIGPFYRLGV